MCYIPHRKVRTTETRNPGQFCCSSWGKEADARGEPTNEMNHQPTTRKVSPKRVVLGSLACLAGLTLLHRPVTHCYRKVEHMCHRPRTFEERAHKILSQSPLIDTHIDFPMVIRASYGNKIDSKDFIDAFENGTLHGDLDLKRLRDGQAGGAFWSVWSPCPKEGQDFAEDNYYPSIRFTLDQIDVMSRIQSLYPNDFSHSKGLHSKDAMKVFKEGKLISPYGIEGLHQIGNSAAVLRDYYDLGVRYATLTHNCHNFYADACQEEYPIRKAAPMWDGVSDKGKAIVDEMNRIGMIVDLSHVSAKTMKDVLSGKDGWEGSRAPTIFSHSSVYSICPHPRNVPDDILELVKETNSVVNINIGSLFLACEDVGADDGLPVAIPGQGTLSKVVEHIMYIGDFIGYDYVGIGTDLDGIPDQPEGFEDVTKYPDVIAELLRRGVSDKDAAKVAGLNNLRVWAAVEEVAADMQAKGWPVLEDEVTYDGPY